MPYARLHHRSVPAYVRDPSTAPPREVWYADAARVFDNLYFVGGKLHSAWPLQTSAGFILLDTIYPYNSEELILGGMQRLGLDPRDIRYVVISHAHGDHIGGAELIQELGAEVVLDPTDWDTIARYPKRYTGMSPHRDIDAHDGMPLTLGDTTVTLWRTPGHTPGTLSYTFTVIDDGRPLNVVYSGGTAFNFPCSTPDPGIRNMQVYIESQRHIAAQAVPQPWWTDISNHGPTMVDRYFVNIEPVESSGVVLTIEGLPRLLIFGRTREEALGRAREALTFHLSAAEQNTETPLIELVLRAAA